jgi:hypothetical protein
MRFSFWKKFLLSLAAVTALGEPAAAQICAPLVPDGGAIGYGLRGNSPRCEGFYQQQVAGSAGVRLVSLTYGRISYDAGRHRELRISLAQAPAASTRIRGEFLPLSRFYRLDAEISQSQPFLSVSLGDVIKPGQIKDDNLGILALRSRQGASEEVIPVAIAADAAPMVPPGTQLHVVLRPGIDVSQLRWRLRAAGQPPDFRAVPGPGGLVPAGTVLRFDLEAPQSPSALLDLRFYNRSGEEITDSIRLAFR